MLLASAYHGLGRKAEAEVAYRQGFASAEKHLELHPGDARALYFGANALSQLGERERSLEWAGRALAMEPEEPQVLYNVACVYALLGEPEQAVECLERSITHAPFQEVWMRNDPDLASLRNHPRFQALTKQPTGNPNL
jgi:Flp pilus assembly protein TadD